MNRAFITSLNYQQLYQQLDRCSGDTNKNILDFVFRVFTSSEERHLFWGDTKMFELQNSTLLELKINFLNLLKTNWGDFCFFILSFHDTPSGLFAIYNVSTRNKRAEILAWIKPEFRRKVLFIQWWILFLNQLQHLKLTRIFAKVRQQNLIAIQTVNHFGFEQCGILPEYFITTNGSESAFIFSRSTDLNSFEVLYNQRRKLI